MPKQINVFHEGITADLDYSKIKNTQWVFPTYNISVFEKGGYGLVVTNINGITEQFIPRQGYIPIAASEVSGILFIVLLERTTTNPKTVIGCYPSPRSYIEGQSEHIDEVVGVTGFENTFKPLPCFTYNGFRVVFKTAVLDFDFEHNISIFGEKTFDGSFNIYIADYKSPNRIINSGFNIDGVLTNTTYTEDTIDELSMQFMLSKERMKLDDYKIIPSGSLLPGNYFIYPRYVTESYDRSDYVAEFGPFQVYK